MVTSAPSADQVRSLVASVEISPPDDFLTESATDSGGFPSEFDDGLAQNLVVGSQLTGFAVDVPADLRAPISNAFLLAQLVADKRSGGSNDTPADGDPQTNNDWINHYVSFLSEIGWLRVGDAGARQVVQGSSLEVHKAIIPVITAALGPAASAASTIISVLQGLDDMDKNQPWITLFDRRSRRADAHQFQIAQTIMEGGIPLVALLTFELNAEREVTQVLFFRFSSQSAALSHQEQKLSVSPGLLKQTDIVISAKISAHIAGNIAALDDLEL